MLRDQCNSLVPITDASGSNYTCVHPKFSNDPLVCRTYEIPIVRLKDCKSRIQTLDCALPDGNGTAPCTNFGFKVGDHGHCRIQEAADSQGRESGFRYEEIVDDFKALLNAFITGITVLVVAVRICSPPSSPHSTLIKTNTNRYPRDFP